MIYTVWNPAHVSHKESSCLFIVSSIVLTTPICSLSVCVCAHTSLLLPPHSVCYGSQRTSKDQLDSQSVLRWMGLRASAADSSIANKAVDFVEEARLRTVYKCLAATAEGLYQSGSVMETLPHNHQHTLLRHSTKPGFLIRAATS